MTIRTPPGLPHGGKGIRVDQPPPPVDRERVVRAFAHAIRHPDDYIPGRTWYGRGPRWSVHDEIGRAVGLPV
jgi:uncharacterized protein YbjT (DUF2867 family)